MKDPHHGWWVACRHGFGVSSADESEPEDMTQRQQLAVTLRNTVRKKTTSNIYWMKGRSSRYVVSLG